MIRAIKRHLKKNGLSRRNKRKDDIIDDQSHNPIEVSNANDNSSSCYLPIDAKLTDESQVIQTNCPVKLGQCKNNRNSNRQVKNNNNYNKNNNNKNQSNNENENESHSSHHCSSSVLIGRRKNVHHEHEDEAHLIEDGNRKSELDSQNETHLVNTSEANGVEANDQPNDFCPIDSPDNLLTSTLVNQITFKQYESLLSKKAMKNEDNGPLNNNQLEHLQSTYSCNHNSSNLPFSGAALMADSSCTRDNRKERIVVECNAVRQALQDLLSECFANVGSKEPSEKLETAVERATINTKDLRRQLPQTIIHHVSDSFLEPNVPLLVLHEAARRGDGAKVELYQKMFNEHAEKLVDVASLACSMSNNEEGVRIVRYVALQINILCPQVINAAKILSARPKSKVAIENMDAFKDLWETQVRILTEAIDDITTIDNFLAVSETHILEDFKECVSALIEHDGDKLDRMAGAIRERAARVCNVVSVEIDNYEPNEYTKRVMNAVYELKDTIMPAFTNKVEKAVELLSNNLFKELDDNQFIGTSRMVYDGVKKIQRAVHFEPEKLTRKIRESFESDCCRSMKRPDYALNNRKHNVESYKETRSLQYSGNCLSTQSMSEFNSKLGYQSNIIDRSGEQIRRGDLISTKPRTTITETSTTVAIKTISPSTSVSLLDDKLKLSAKNLIDCTKLKSSPSNQICSLVNTSQKKSSSNINLVHNLTSIHSSSSSSLPPSSSLIHSSTSSSLSSALVGSPLSSSSSCSSPKKILFDRNVDNAETSNLDSSLFQVNARSNKQEKRILFILASNQPNSSSISSSSSSFSSTSASSSSFSIEKSNCDNKSINKPTNLKLRALSSSSSDSKSIPSLDKDSPISGEISSDTNGELGSKDEGYSTMSSDVQSDATLSGSLFISNNNATNITSTNTIFPVNPLITKQSTECNSGKTILIEKQNFTTSKPLPLSALISKQSCETVEIRSGSTMGVNGSTTPIAMKLSAVNPIVVGSCRLTTFKDLPEDCSIKSTISTQNTSFTSSNDNCNNNNTKMNVLREEEDFIEKDKNNSTEDYNLNSNCSKAATNGNKSSWSDNCEVHNLNSSHSTRQPCMDIMRKSKKGNHPHRYTFPPTSKSATVDGIECTPCVISDFKPSLRADFKSIDFRCNSLTKKSTQSIDSNGWPKSRLIDKTEKVTCTGFCDKDVSIYLNHCIVENVEDVKIDREKSSNAVDTNGDKFDGKIGQTNIKTELVRSRRLTSLKGEMNKTDDRESDLEKDEKGCNEHGIVTFKIGKPRFKRKSIIVTHFNHVNKPGSSTSLSSSDGSYSLSRSYSDSQLYSNSKDEIASIGKKRATHETTSTCKPSGLIRRRVKRETRACNQSLRWSILSTSSSALSDGLEAPICYERRRCRPRPTDLPIKYISSDENHSTDDEDSHEKFVSRWLRNGTGGLRWDDSEVTWKLNESLDWPESLDYISSKKDDNFEEIPLLDDESDKIEIVTSVLLSSSKAEIADNSSDMASSVLDDNLVPETNFNGNFYRLCSVGSKTSLPEVPGLLSPTLFPLTDVKESVPNNENLSSSYSVVKESTDDIGLNEIKIIEKQCLDSNQEDEEILFITSDVDHLVESFDQQKESMKPSSESASLTSQLPVESLQPSLAIKTESQEKDKTNTELLVSKTDDKIVIINHIPINPSTTKSSSCTLTTTSITSPTKSLSPCSSNFSLKSSNSGQSSSTDKCRQTKSTINPSTGLKEKKPLKTFKSPVKESTAIIVNNKNKENHEENVKERSTLRDCNRTERSSEKGSENASLSSSSQTRPIPSLIKSHSSNYAKLSSATRIPLPKQSNSLDQIKAVKDVKLRHDTTEIGERMSTKNLIPKFSANSKKPTKQELTKSSINNSKINNSDSNSTGLISANSSKNEEKSEKVKEYIKNVETKRLRSEKSYNPSRKATDVPANELKSPTAPSVEEFERRLSEDKQMAEKIKEFYSLFEERQSFNVECSSNKSKVNNSDKPILESFQCKLNYPKAILRRPKGEPAKTSKEGHETSWVHVSGFSVGKSENYVEKPTSSSSTVINVNKNSTSKLSSDSCSSEDEANFNFNGKRRSSFHQRLLALHRSRRQRKRASGRYMGMGFLPRIRASIVDRLDFYHRFGEKEQKALSSFNFLNEFSISPLSSSSSSPVIECFEKFAEEQRLLIRCYLNSFSQLSQSSSLPASCSPPFTSKWPQSPSSSSLKCSPSRHQPSVAEHTNYINDSELNRKTIGTDYVDLITPNSFV